MLVIVVVAMFLKRYKEGFLYCKDVGCFATGSANFTISAGNVSDFSTNYGNGYTTLSATVDVGTITKGTGVTEATFTASNVTVSTTGTVSYKLTAFVKTTTNSTKTNGDYYNCTVTPTATVSMKHWSTTVKNPKTVTATSSKTINAQLFVPSTGTVTISVY